VKKSELKAIIRECLEEGNGPARQYKKATGIKHRVNVSSPHGANLSNRKMYVGSGDAKHERLKGIIQHSRSGGHEWEKDLDLPNNSYIEKVAVGGSKQDNAQRQHAINRGYNTHFGDKRPKGSFKKIGKS